MTSYRDRLNPHSRKYEPVGKPSFDGDGELQEKMKKTFGSDIVERLTARLPGTGPKTLPYGYTSEAEIRERISEIVNKPIKKLSPEMMKKVGIDLDPMLQKTFNATKGKRLTDEEREALGERWVQKRIDAAKKQSRLMTDQQLADWRMTRKLCEGDRARFIGPTRNEITQAQLIVPRPTGQEGIITRVRETRDARIITFHPMEAVQPVEAPTAERQFVDLQVREHTKGWLDLERIPLDPEEKVE
jgi:hypothetical protein